MDPRPISLEPERWLDYCEKCSNAELFANLHRLDAGEAQALTAIIAHLSELDARRAAAETSHPTLFAYCTKVRGYSQAEAFLRELDLLISELAPVPERRAVIRSLSVGPRPTPIKMAAAQGRLFAQGGEGPSDILERAAPEAPPAAVQTLSAAPSYPQIRLMAPRASVAREVTRHKFPAGRPEQIFAAALDDLLDRRDPERRLVRKEKRRAQRQAGQGVRTQPHSFPP